MLRLDPALWRQVILVVVSPWMDGPIYSCDMVFLRVEVNVNEIVPILYYIILYYIIIQYIIYIHIVVICVMCRHL